MNSASKHAVIAFFAIALAGCTDKKPQAVQPAQAQAPALDPGASTDGGTAGKAGALYPPPLTQSDAQATAPAPSAPPVDAKVEPVAPQPAPAKTLKLSSPRKKPSPSKPASESENADASAPAQAPSAPEATQATASAGETSAASPIGQLSTGDPGQIETRKDTVDLIASTENGLSGIKRTLSSQEQETATQIKTFIAKAREALKNEDLDGAHTLAIKAKVLLDELNKT